MKKLNRNLIKEEDSRSQAFHSFHGHSFFSICSVFVCLYSKNNKTKTQEESFYLFFFNGILKKIEFRHVICIFSYILLLIQSLTNSHILGRR